MVECARLGRSTVVAVLLAHGAALLALGASHVPAASHEQSLPPWPAGQVKDLAPGKLLVAARNLQDPNFVESVILLVDCDEQHAVGLIVNRQTEVPLSRVFKDLTEAREQSAPVYSGGPVGVTGVLALLRSNVARAAARHVVADVYLINTLKLLEDVIAARTRPDRLRVYLGYAGWGRGQLQMETARGAWHVFPGDARVVFDVEPDSLWPRQIRRIDDRMALSRMDLASTLTLR